MPIRTLDLFCGGGGSSWGAQAAGAEIVCGVDAWDLAIKAYQRNFPGAAKVPATTLTERSSTAVVGDIGPIDLILASPECTHHTCARGNRPREESSKRTAFYVTRFARAFEPRWVVIENVVHFKSWDGYLDLIEEMRRLGYNLRTVDLDASSYGVPQARRRVFILCDREAEPPATIRKRPGPAPAVKSILDAEGTWSSRPLFGAGRANPTIQRARRAMRALGRGVPFIIVYYGSDGSGGWQPLDRPLRTITTLDRFGLVTWDGDEPMLRMLQVPELMRAMGFSGGYSLDGIGQRRDRIKLLGNGVCPPVMAAIVSAMTVKSGDAAAEQPEFPFRVAAE
jgi:DNA (cytosine-5)-methyltransferase 1